MPRDTWTPGNPSGTDRSYDRGGDRQRDIARRQAPPPERQHPFGGIDATRYAQNLAKQRYRTGVQDIYRDRNFGTGQGGGIRGFLGNIGNKLGAWAGNMRGGINPLTNEYYTQEEYKDNVQARRDRARIDRLRRTRDEGKYANDPRGWEASDLSGRLAGLENQFGITGVASNINYPRETEVTEEMIYPQRKPFVPPASEYEGMFPDTGGVTDVYPPSMLRGSYGVIEQPETISSEIDYNIPYQKRISGASGVDQENIALASVPTISDYIDWTGGQASFPHPGQSELDEFNRDKYDVNSDFFKWYSNAIPLTRGGIIGVF